MPLLFLNFEFGSGSRFFAHFLLVFLLVFFFKFCSRFWILYVILPCSFAGEEFAGEEGRGHRRGARLHRRRGGGGRPRGVHRSIGEEEGVSMRGWEERREEELTEEEEG